MFLVFFAPLPILLRRGWTKPRCICAFFVLVYLAYWATVMISLRYAIVPFALIVLSIASALVRLDVQSSLPTRLALRFGIFASFVFSLLGVLTFEVNSLQIAYLFKRVTAASYLSQALPTTPILFHLRETDANAAVFGVANCSRLYAPNPLRFHCILCPEGHCTLPEVLKAIGTTRYDYLILPTGSDFDKVRNDVLARGKTIEVHRDLQFVAYRLMSDLNESQLTK